MTTVKYFKKLFDNFETNINEEIAKLEEELKKDNSDVKKKNDLIQEGILQIRNTIIERLSNENDSLRSRVQTSRLVQVERTININQQHS